MGLGLSLIISLCAQLAGEIAQPFFFGVEDQKKDIESILVLYEAKDAPPVPDYEHIFVGSEEEQKSKLNSAAAYLQHFDYVDSSDEPVVLPPSSIYPKLKDYLLCQSTKFSNGGQVVLLMKRLPQIPVEEYDFLVDYFALNKRFQELWDLSQLFKKMNPEKLEERLLTDLRRYNPLPEWLLEFLKTYGSDFLLKDSVLPRLIELYKHTDSSNEQKKSVLRELLFNSQSRAVDDVIFEEWNENTDIQLVSSFYQRLSRSTHADSMYTLQLRAAELAKRITHDPNLCAHFQMAVYWVHGQPNTVAYQWVYDEILKSVLERRVPIDQGEDLIRNCIPNFGLTAALSDDLRASLIRDWWPRFIQNGEFLSPAASPSGFSGLHALSQFQRYNSEQRLSNREIDFYTLALIPALQMDASARELAEYYLKESDCQENGRVVLDAQILANFYRRGGRSESLVRAIAKDRLLEPAFSEFHQRLREDRDFDELVTESDEPSQYALAYARERFSGTRFLNSGLFYGAISSKWKYRARSIAADMASYHELFDRARDERALALAQIYNSDPSEDFSKRISIEELSLYLRSVQSTDLMLSTSRRKELFEFLPGDRASENLVASILWLLGSQMEHLSTEERSLLKDKALAAFDIHLHKSVDESLLLVFREFSRASEEDRLELAEKIKELE